MRNRMGLLQVPGGGGVMQAGMSAFQILYAICSVLLRICAGDNSKRPLCLMGNYWAPYMICSLIFQKWRRFCRARICRVIFSPARIIPHPLPR